MMKIQPSIIYTIKYMNRERKENIKNIDIIKKDVIENYFNNIENIKNIENTENTDEWIFIKNNNIYNIKNV